MTTRLNLGCGGVIAPGWINVDRAWDENLIPPGQTGERVTHDLTTLPLPFDDASVDGVLFCHSLCMLDREPADRLLVDVRRVLRPGGVLRIVATDILAGVRAAQRGDWSWFPEPRYNSDESFNGEATVGYFITQGGARRQALWPELVVTLLSELGYVQPGSRVLLNDGRWDTSAASINMNELDSRPGESFCVEAFR